MKHLLAIPALALALGGTAAFAQDGNKPNQNGANAAGGLDSTLTVLPENAQVPSAVTDHIQIPQQGIDTANGAREAASARDKQDGQAFGAETSANAKDKQDGKSFGAATAAAAQAREDSQDSQDSQDTQDAQDGQDGQDAFGQANAAAAQQLEDSARAFGDATSAAAQQEHEDFSQGSRPTQTPPDVQNLPAVQDPPGDQAPPSTPGKP